MELDEEKRRSEKRSAMYSNPISRIQKDDQAKRDAEAKRLSPLREKHDRERAALQDRHRFESEKLRHDQTVERDHHSQFPSQPAGMDAKHKAAREKLTKKHESERSDLKSKHEAEMSRAKQAKRA
jgi:hypothetical protein